MKKQKGITLIALIITIIVMVILVAVTVNVALNGGIFENAENAKEQTQVAANKETLFSAVVAAMGTDGEIDYDALDEEARALGFTKVGKGEYTKDGYTYTVDEITGIVTASKASVQPVQVPEELRAYILGTGGTGRTDITSLIKTIGGINFINDESQIPAEYLDIKRNLGTLNILYYALVSSNSIYSNSAENKISMDFYFEYENEMYKFRIEDTNEMTNIGTTSGLVKLSYENETKAIGYENVNIGDTVSFGEKTWIIMYNDTQRGVQMISQDVLSSVELGENDENATGATPLEKAIWSYNNAIDTLNDACGRVGIVVGGDMTIRSVGTNPINSSDPKRNNNTLSTGYITTIPTGNPGAYSGVAKEPDYEYETDFDRLVAMGENVKSNEYWLASRLVHIDESTIRFNLRSVRSGMSLPDEHAMFSVSTDEVYENGRSYGVRPVISLVSASLIANTNGLTDWKIEQSFLREYAAIEEEDDNINGILLTFLDGGTGYYQEIHDSVYYDPENITWRETEGDYYLTLDGEEFSITMTEQGLTWMGISFIRIS